jgi:hypothetical protein
MERRTEGTRKASAGAPGGGCGRHPEGLRRGTRKRLRPATRKASAWARGGSWRGARGGLRVGWGGEVWVGGGNGVVTGATGVTCTVIGERRKFRVNLSFSDNGPPGR